MIVRLSLFVVIVNSKMVNLFNLTSLTSAGMSRERYFELLETMKKNKILNQKYMNQIVNNYNHLHSRYLQFYFRPQGCRIH